MGQRTQADKRYVAFIDILGFSSIVATRELSKVVDIVRALLHGMDSLGKSGFVRIKEGGSIESELLEFGSLHFSDTIVLWTPPVEDADHLRRGPILTGFMLNLGNSLWSGLATGIPLRLGIAYGDVIVSKEEGIVVGQPLVDAADIEKRQNWVGGALHRTCFASGIGSLEVSSPAVHYKVPVKGASPSDIEIALDWTHIPRVASNLPGHGEWRPREFLEPLIQEAKDESVRAKYSNTLEFALEVNIPIPSEWAIRARNGRVHAADEPR